MYIIQPGPRGGGREEEGGGCLVEDGNATVYWV